VGGGGLGGAKLSENSWPLLVEFEAVVVPLLFLDFREDEVSCDGCRFRLNDLLNEFNGLMTLVKELRRLSLLGGLSDCIEFELARIIIKLLLLLKVL